MSKRMTRAASEAPLTCHHAKDLVAYQGRLFLCVRCLTLYCEACALEHEHETIPPVRKA